MAMIVLHSGQVQWLQDLLAGGTLEAINLGLYATSHTPAVTDTLSTYAAIAASFAGYSAKLLTRSIAAGTWSVPTVSGTTIDPAGINARSTYNAASPQAWTATSAQVIYGYYLWGVTSGNGLAAEQFASSVSLTNPSTLQLVPVLELGPT
jgi:hypothetical protein